VIANAWRCDVLIYGSGLMSIYLPNEIDRPQRTCIDLVITSHFFLSAISISSTKYGNNQKTSIQDSRYLIPWSHQSNHPCHIFTPHDNVGAIYFSCQNRYGMSLIMPYHRREIGRSDGKIVLRKIQTSNERCGRQSAQIGISSSDCSRQRRLPRSPSPNVAHIPPCSERDTDSKRMFVLCWVESPNDRL
jgi:hypothetical protein